jgi:hypothetical protein
MPIFVKPSLFKSHRINGLSKRPVSRYENNYGGALLLRAGISLVGSTDHHLLLCPFTLLKTGGLRQLPLAALDYETLQLAIHPSSSSSAFASFRSGVSKPSVNQP